MVGLVANRRDGFISAAIHQQPTGSPGLIQQVFDPAVEHLAQMGRTTGLLQVPQQGSGLSVEGLDLQPGG
jgi:hypothetical protein